MNMEYWIGVVNALIPISFCMTIIGAFTTAFLLTEIYSPTINVDPSKLKVPIIVAAVITVLFLLLWIFVPSIDAIRAMYR